MQPLFELLVKKHKVNRIVAIYDVTFDDAIQFPFIHTPRLRLRKHRLTHPHGFRRQRGTNVLGGRHPLIPVFLCRRHAPVKQQVFRR